MSRLTYFSKVDCCAYNGIYVPSQELQILFIDKTHAVASFVIAFVHRRSEVRRVCYHHSGKRNWVLPEVVMITAVKLFEAFEVGRIRRSPGDRQGYQTNFKWHIFKRIDHVTTPAYYPFVKVECQCFSENLHNVEMFADGVLVLTFFITSLQQSHQFQVALLSTYYSEKIATTPPINDAQVCVTWYRRERWR